MTVPYVQPATGHIVRLSLRRIAAAQALPLLVGGPIALMLIFPFGAALDSLRLAGLDIRLVDFCSSFLIYFIQSAVLALIQWFLIKRVVNRPVFWVIGTGLLGVAILPSLFPLTVRVILGIAHLQPTPEALILLSGLIGAGYGIILSGVQALWMKASRRRWVWMSVLVWALAWAAAFPLIYSVLYLKN